jgi:hypothetical protein
LLVIGQGTIGFGSLDDVFNMLDSNTGDTLWQVNGEFLLCGTRGQTIYAYDPQHRKVALERDGTIRCVNEQEFVPLPAVMNGLSTINGILYTYQITWHYDDVSRRLLRAIGEDPELVLSGDCAVALLDAQTYVARWMSEPVWGNMTTPRLFNGCMYVGVTRPAKKGAARILAYRDPFSSTP